MPFFLLIYRNDQQSKFVPKLKRAEWNIQTPFSGWYSCTYLIFILTTSRFWYVNNIYLFLITYRFLQVTLHDSSIEKLAEKTEDAEEKRFFAVNVRNGWIRELRHCQRLLCSKRCMVGSSTAVTRFVLRTIIGEQCDQQIIVGNSET